jgi:deoxyribodipyrimidine photo-lyase
MTSPVLVWFRRDLRLADQAALAAAVASGAPVIPVYILDDETPKHRAMGGASRWYLHHSLESLSHDLAKLGSRLILRNGRSDAVLAQLAQETGASEVHALHHYEPWWRNAEHALAGGSLTLHLHHGNYLSPPGTITTGAGTPYRIFTPFWRALQQHLPPHQPTAAPDRLITPDQWPESDRLDDWELLPKHPDWAAGFRENWIPGEGAAAQALDEFADQAAHYAERRNLPSITGTSRLSPHLHFGEISPAAAWHAVAGAGGSSDVFLAELGWRDYAQNIILQFPDYGTKAGRDDYADFPWRQGPDADSDLRAWQRGRTGYPLVDAGMRQLWAIGWMHNRLRLVTSSFLTKHLLLDWQAGERWFWDTLVDGDYGSNTMNWQWSAGTGVDANLFVRIMAPLTQSVKFNAADYIRQWVPELAHLSDADIHDPPHPVPGYPAKLIEHREGRARALAAYAVWNAQRFANSATTPET